MLNGRVHFPPCFSGECITNWNRGKFKGGKGIRERIFGCPQVGQDRGIKRFSTSFSSWLLLVCKSRVQFIKAFTKTMKPGYKDYSRETENLAFMDRWSLKQV